VIAKIVHEANLHDGKFTRQESTSVDLAIKGLAVATQDDHEPPRVGAMDTCYAVSSSLRRRHPPGDCPLK